MNRGDFRALSAPTVLGVLFLSAAGLVLLSLAFPFYAGADTSVIAVIAVVGVLAGAPLVAVGARWRGPATGLCSLAVALGATLIAFGVVAAGESASSTIGVFLVFVASFAGFYLPRWVAVSLIGYGGVAYGVALWLLEHPAGVAEWVIVVGATSVAGLLLGAAGAALRDQLRRERSLVAALRESHDRQTTLLHGVAHDVRGPLVAAAGLADLLREDALEEVDRAEVLDRLMRSIEKSGRVVDDLVEVGRAGGSAPDAGDGPVDLPALVERTVAGLDDDRGRVRLALRPVSARVDVRGVERALENVLVNALRYAPGPSPVVVELIDLGDVVELAVTDQGPGIPEELREAMFEWSVRGPAAADGDRGEGVGLTLARQIVEAQKGTISIQDGPDGRGSRVVIRLPKQRAGEKRIRHSGDSGQAATECVL